MSRHINQPDETAKAASRATQRIVNRWTGRPDDYVPEAMDFKLDPDLHVPSAERDDMDMPLAARRARGPLNDWLREVRS